MSDRLYRKRPVECEAVRWTGENFHELEAFAIGHVDFVAQHDKGFERFELTLLAGKDGAQGWVDVPVGHWIVCNPGDDTDFWPVENEYFNRVHEFANAVGKTLTRADIERVSKQSRENCAAGEGCLVCEGMRILTDNLLASVSPTPCPTNHTYKYWEGGENYSTRSYSAKYKFCPDCGAELS